MYARAAQLHNSIMMMPGTKAAGFGLGMMRMPNDIWLNRIL